MHNANHSRPAPHSNPVSAALELAECGVAVFPAEAETKRPLTAHGYKDATIRPRVVKRLWRQHPDALVAVPTGSPSGLLVVDVDPAGRTWLGEHVDDLDAPRLHVSRRGFHLVYAVAEDGERVPCSAGRIAAGVDVRGDGGYVVWWPASGLEVVGADLEALTAPPAWLVTKMRSASRPVSEGVMRTRNDWAERLATIRLPGERNATVASVFGHLLHTCKSASEALELTHVFNEGRCEPPLPEAEVDRTCQSIAERELRRRRSKR